MAVREVIGVGDHRLSSRARRVEAFDSDLKELLADLIDTMRVSPGCVGLAANQIGDDRSVFVIDVANARRVKTYSGLIVAVNPEIVSLDGLVELREGCMSVPDFTGAVPRYQSLVLAAEDEDGVPFKLATDGFEAQAIQHECDHLLGFTFLDRIAAPSKMFSRKRYL
ncbi:MAG: peptide deformylase [Actinomycetota bacterium]|nr:peptide deformylase [Actinomycetota bacterium]